MLYCTKPRHKRRVMNFPAINHMSVAHPYGSGRIITLEDIRSALREKGMLHTMKDIDWYLADGRFRWFTSWANQETRTYYWNTQEWFDTQAARAADGLGMYEGASPSGLAEVLEAPPGRGRGRPPKGTPRPLMDRPATPGHVILGGSNMMSLNFRVSHDKNDVEMKGYAAQWDDKYYAVTADTVLFLMREVSAHLTAEPIHADALWWLYHMKASPAIYRGGPQKNRRVYLVTLRRLHNKFAEEIP